MTRILLGLAGPPASGKTSVGAMLRDRHGFALVDLGDLVRETMPGSVLPPTRKALQAAGAAIRRADGEGTLARRGLARAKGSRVVLAGIRRAGEVDVLRGAGGVLVVVQAPLDVRFGRDVQRGRESPPPSLPAFTRADAAETGRGAVDPATADATIENDGTLEDLAVRVAALVERLAAVDRCAGCGAVTRPMDGADVFGALLCVTCARTATKGTSAESDVEIAAKSAAGSGVR